MRFSCPSHRNQSVSHVCKSSSPNIPGNISEKDAIVSSLNDLKTKVDKIEGELIDVVNQIEAKTHPTRNESINSNKKRKLSPSRPSYQNPVDIPAYDLIETIEVAEVHAADDSIITVDEFVPESENPTSPSSCLNSNLPTSRLQ